MRIIFLDVDGVLNNCGTRERSNRGMIGVDPKKVRLLKNLQEASGARIVLSSTWREEWEPSYEDCGPDGKYLSDSLANGGVEVFDKIPGWSGIHRGEEIRQYAKQCGCRSFLVLDDQKFPDFTVNGIRESGSRANWIHTDFYSRRGGLRKEHIPLALQLFEQQERLNNGDHQHEDRIHSYGPVL